MKIELSKVISYSRDALQSRSQMRNIMLDLFPGCTLEMNILLSVYESGIPREIKANGTITQAQYLSYIQRIVDTYGLQEKYAKEGLDTWIDVCLPNGTSAKYKDIGAIEVDKKEQITSPKIDHNYGQPGTPQIVTGDAADYEVKDFGDGTIEIVKYIGFDQKEIKIPNKLNGKNVVGIGAGAYMSCKGLEKVIMSEGITYIASKAFANCSLLSEVQLPTTLEKFVYRVMPRDRYSMNSILNGGSLSDGVFAGSSIKKIDIPNKVKSLPKDCFAECSKLEMVILPDNLEEIGDGAFRWNHALKSIVLPRTVRKVGANAFYGCEALTDAELNEGLVEIGSSAFEKCNKLNKLVIPSTVTVFGSGILGNDRMARYGLSTQPDKTLYCYAGSKAIEHARNNGYKIENAATL